MKRLLITGARGLLGSACGREFINDHDVILNDGHIDFRNRDAVQSMFMYLKPQIVIHCAAKVGGVKANKENPVDFMLENLTMQNNVIEAAHDHCVEKLCFIGTSCMFPCDAALPVEESSLFTGSLEDSVEAYAIAKIAGWRLCKAYWEQYGDKFITVAPSNIFGINDSYGESAHVIPALIRKCNDAHKSGTRMEVWGDGRAVREFIFSDDVARAIRLLLTHWNTPDVVNIGTGIGVTIRDLVAAIGEASPYDSIPEIKWDTSAPIGIPRKTFSISKLTSLGWQPQVSLAEGLKLTWKDFLTGKPRGI
jgi:GDP-L-fucose synthase